jgi:hypothetical protein
MKRYIFFFINFFILSAPVKAQENKLFVYTDKYKTVTTEGMYINCLTINDLGVLMPITGQMKSYDIFKLELHRFGDDIDIIAASKTFDPNSKLFKKKFASKDALKIKILVEETDFEGSDLEPNTLIFPVNSTVNSIFCKSRDLKYCSFYLIVRGYKRTGEKTQFGEDIFDNGVDLSSKSTIFKSWEDKTIRKDK